MKYIRKFDSAAALQAAIQAGTIERPFVAWDSTESTTNLEFGELTEAPTTEAPVTVDYTEPFYIEDISGSDNTIQIMKNHTNAPVLNIQKSTDGTTWETMGSTSKTAITATIPANSKLYLRCSATKWAQGVSIYNYFNSASGDFNVGGNIMSLLYGSNFTGNETTLPSGSKYTFMYLFYNNTHLVEASNLLFPATTSKVYCYGNMFNGCTSLISAPALPATTLNECCYSDMFSGCTSLTSAPALPATTLAPGCYLEMFNGCSSLTTAPTTLPGITLAQDCYKQMFWGCTSLTTAPELPATTLAQRCYGEMFYGCTNLNYIKCLATDVSANSCTMSWVTGVAAPGTFVKSPSMSDWTTGNNGIPSGWTVEDAA